VWVKISRTAAFYVIMGGAIVNFSTYFQYSDPDDNNDSGYGQAAVLVLSFCPAIVWCGLFAW